MKEVLGEMETSDKIMAVGVMIAMVALAWFFISLGLSLFADGWLYEIEQPAPAKAIGETIIVTIDRHSMLDMQADCHVEVVCEFVHRYEPYSCPIRAGHEVFKTAFKTPPVTAAEECRVEGVVVYQPLGVLGPTLTHSWRSEQFALGGG